MRRIQYIPGAIATPNPHTLPSGSPGIQSVVSAEITRLPVGMANLANHTQAQIVAAVGDHTQAAVVAAIANHAVHAHALITQGTGAPPAGGALGLPAGLDVLNDAAAAAPHTVAGAGATGVQNNAAAQAHAASATAVAHAAGAAAVAHAAAANPVVAAAPTRLSNTTFSLSVNTLVGDLLTIVYNEVGERVLVS